MKKTIILIVVLFLILLAGIYIKSFIRSSRSPQTKIITYKCQNGKTAYQLLEQNSSMIESQDSSFGKMVTSINGISQGDGKYWLYDIDGKEATVSASAYTCQNNEQIKWQLK